MFIHWINVRYLVQQQRIGEGRATMRVRFILNTLNNADEDKGMRGVCGLPAAQCNHTGYQNHEPALSEQQPYFDMPLSANMFAGVRMNYEVWFRESSRVEEIQGLGKGMLS